ncbi:MAG: GIY-YIG nuclease family protein [Planctomycetota bacterium]
MAAGKHTYFIQQGRGGPIKIGVASDPLSRLAALQTGNPEQLFLLGSIKGDCEGHLHRKFAKHRLVGEWFKPHQQLLRYIAKHGISNKPHGILEHGEEYSWNYFVVAFAPPKQLMAEARRAGVKPATFQKGRARWITGTNAIAYVNALARYEESRAQQIADEVWAAAPRSADVLQNSCNTLSPAQAAEQTDVPKPN